jgi:hypothetical protein
VPDRLHSDRPKDLGCLGESDGMKIRLIALALILHGLVL